MKKIFCLLLTGFLLCNCSKNTNQNTNIDASVPKIKSSNALVNGMELVKPELAVRIIPDDWKSKFIGSESSNRYALGKMVSHDNESDQTPAVWLCLIHFSEDMDSSVVEACKQITDNK